MADDRHERIRARAHAIWEREGQPQGAHDRHWHQATSEIDAEGVTDEAPAKAPRKRAAGAKGAGPALAEHSKDAAKPKRRTSKTA